jgi:hypothetical protein
MFTQHVKSAARGSHAAQQLAKGQSAAPPPRCLLIVSGAPDCLKRTLAALDMLEVEITWTASPEEAASACRCGYDLVIVDVEPQHVANVLKTVRESAELADHPVLVEPCRMEAAPGLAGVLPRYRAMPCGFADLLKLVHWYLFPATSPQPPFGVSAGRLL